MRLIVRALGVAAGLACSMLWASPVVAQRTTGTIRGVVTDQTGQPVDGAEVTAVNLETGVALRVTTGADGRYVVFGLPVGPYNIRARRLGYRPTETQNIHVNIAETVSLNFRLPPAPALLEEVIVTGELKPLIDQTQSGTVDLITEAHVEAIPVNGRNFADLVALSPSVQLAVGDGSGGNLSLGGGRRGASLIQIDGAGATGTFFGGEARGSDRIPFAYSIEAVREFQVVTNAYDVEYGFFAGGLINAVTKSGSNEVKGSVFGFFRNDAFTGNDFFDNEPTEFNSRQIGGTVSGPIVRDKLHFYVAVERQDRDEPIFGLPAPGASPDSSTSVHPDSIARFLDILQTTYGIDEEAGRFTQTQDEWTAFGRVDWQLSERHRLTLRHNFTDLDSQFDRISSNELRGNGGVFKNRGNSTVLSLSSFFSPTVYNEFRAQYATEPRPREATSLLPQARVDITSDFGGGVTRRITAECCNDPVLPNNLEETTFELANNLHVRTGGHAFKAGVNFNLFSYENFFFFNQQGTYRFRTLADFQNGVVRDFARALPNPGPDGQYFTADDLTPLALYDVQEFAFYAQDSWHVGKLNLTVGARYDLTRFPDRARLNQALVTDLNLRTDVAPRDNNLSPRVGFTYDLSGDGQTVVRGGAGLFYGRFPAVLYSNSLLNTGDNQLSLFCSGAQAPPPNYQQFASDLTSIPTACVGGGAAAPPVPAINLFDQKFEYPEIIKSNLGLERALTSSIKIGVDLMYSKTTSNFYVEDRNLLAEQFRSGLENRPVFAPQNRISSGGSVSFGANRTSTAFSEVLLHTSPAESRTYQAVVSLEGRVSDRTTFQASYSYSNTEDNSSYSCCISSTALFETPTAGNPNFLGEPGDKSNGTWGPADFDRRHTMVASAITELPWQIQLSGILRATSGRPWTPIIDGDANGDARFGNDRAFIGTNLNFDDPAVDQPLMQGFIQQWKCVADQVGGIASRNSCRNPWNYMLDLRVRRAFRTVGSQRLELVADFFNLLNLINSDWSRNVGVVGSNAELLVVEGYSVATGTYRYSVNPSFGRETDLSPFRTDQFQAQLGVRYSF